MVKVKNGEILIYGDIVDNTDSELIDILDSFRGRPVTVRINSRGGYVNVGVAAYYALKRHSGRVTTIVDSLAASIASVIALGGSVRLTEPAARWMIHNASISNISGNARELGYVVEILQEYDSTLRDIYAGYMKPGLDIAGMMDRETYFSAKLAVEAGLATGIVGAVPTAKTKALATAWKGPKTLNPLHPRMVRMRMWQSQLQAMGIK